MKHLFRQPQVLLPVLTGRGIALLLVAAALALMGLFSGADYEDTLALVLGYLLILFVLSGVDGIRLYIWLRGAELFLQVPNMLASGVSEKLEVHLEGKKFSGMRSIVFAPTIPEHVALLGAQDFPQRYAVAKADEHGWCAALVFRPLRCGTIVWRECYSRFQGRWRCLSWQARWKLAEPIICQVQPNAFCNEDSRVLPFRRMLAGQLHSNIRGIEGLEVDSLRAYAVGDDLRKVHWKQSSRRESLVVRVYRSESHQRISIAIDCSRRLGGLVDGRIRLESLLDLAAYLMRVAEANDDEVALYAFHHAELLRQASTRVARSQERLRTELAQLSVGHLDPDYDLLLSWGQQLSRRSLFVVMTSLANPLNVEQIGQVLRPLCRKHLPLVVALRDQSLESMAQESAATLEDAYLIAAAKEQEQQIAERVHSLQRLGIECLLAGPRDLPQRLREKYFTLKYQGRI